MNNIVAVINVDKAEYPAMPPFDPSHHYPEYPYGEEYVAAPPNHAYQGIRESLIQLGYDQKNYGKSSWNPLVEIVAPGDKVVIKPNFVMHENRSGSSINAVLTDASLIRAILDYVIIALQGKGDIFIVDAPQYDADFETIVELTGIRRMVDELQKRTDISITLADLRIEMAIEKDGLVIERKKLIGDPNGYISVDLGEKSCFSTLMSSDNNLRGSDYDGIETVQHHRQNKHEYLISKTVLNADVFINIPKLKTHRKTGVTLCLKNLIGINGDKNWIPHFTLGGPLLKGDEHSSASRLRDFECIFKDRFKSFVYHTGPIGLSLSRYIRMFQKSVVDHTHFFDVRGGAWYGNDTLWRSILDLNKILFYADTNGVFHGKLQRKYFAVIDGIIGGQGEGPYHSHPIPSGCIISGTHPVMIDMAATQFMGYSYNKIRKIAQALRDTLLCPMDDVAVDIRSNNQSWLKSLSEGQPCFNFTPPSSWKGHIELDYL